MRVFVPDMGQGLRDTTMEQRGRKLVTPPCVRVHKRVDDGERERERESEGERPSLIRAQMAMMSRRLILMSVISKSREASPLTTPTLPGNVKLR